MTKVSVNLFNRGMKNDPRNGLSGSSRVLTNFDALANPKKLTPYRDSEAVTDGAGTSGIKVFAVALRTGSTYSLYGLGHETSQVYARVFYKSLTTGGTNDLGDGTWTETANNIGTAGAVSTNFFMYYRKTGYMYGGHGGTKIWRYDPSGSGAWVDDHQSLSYTTINQGLVHSKDDIMYVPYDNCIATNNNGVWSNTALTISANLVINSICEYGNYLAIAAAPLSGIGHSFVFLWDRDSALTTISESIDWGEGSIKVLEQVDGSLVGISAIGGSVAGTTRFASSLAFKSWNGGSEVTQFEELKATNTSVLLSVCKQKINNRLYFMSSVLLNGATREGVFSVGKVKGEFSIFHERTPNNDTALASGTINGFLFVGDYLFQSFSTSGTNTLSKTNDAASYTATSIFESSINPDMLVQDKSFKKKLKSVGATYEALPAAGQIVIKVKVDGGSYKTIFTETTDGQVRTEPSGVLADGTYLSDGTELEFRAESSGGAELTSFNYEYEVLASN